MPQIKKTLVSRAERAEKMLPLPKVLAWARACGASEDVLKRLAELTEAAFTQSEAWRDLFAETSQLQDAVRGTIGLQLERVITVARQDNVTLGVIPTATNRFHGFTIYADRNGDDPFVSFELVHNYVTVHDPTDIELYRDIYRRLSAAAVTGPDAVALIQRVAAELRV